MVLSQRQVWKIISGVGFVFMLLYLVSNIVFSVHLEEEYLQSGLHPGYLHSEYNQPEKKSFPRPPALMIMNILGVLVFLYLFIFSPSNYYIYGVFCLIYSLAILAAGGNVIGFLLFLLACAFANKCNFFDKRGKGKWFILISLLLLAIGTQFRFGFDYIFLSLAYIIVTLLLLSLAVLLFLPEIERLRGRDPQVFRLPPADFIRRDLLWLQRIQAGEKYEAIAADHGIALSTLKNRVRILFEKLGVQDRTMFLAAYAHVSLVLDSPSKEPVPEPALKLYPGQPIH
jgi:DNA-binding CsgD family transcriptional regulator